MGFNKELVRRTQAARAYTFTLYLGGMRQCDIARKLERSRERTRGLLAKAIRERGLVDRRYDDALGCRLRRSRPGKTI